MANERITENIVREILRSSGYYKDGVTVEEQISQIDAVKRLLKKASKKSTDERGAPEFIISSASAPDFLIIIECKAEVKNHESKKHDQPDKKAVDGALHYANVLSKAFNVVAIGVSGQSERELAVSCFVQARGQKVYQLKNKAGHEINKILSLEEIIEHASYRPEIEKNRTDDLMSFSRELHDFMRDHAKLAENEKPLLVLLKASQSIALQNFNKSGMRLLKRNLRMLISQGPKNFL